MKAKIVRGRKLMHPEWRGERIPKKGPKWVCPVCKFSFNNDGKKRCKKCGRARVVAP